MVSGGYHALNYLSCIKLFHIIFMSVFIKVHFSLWGVQSCYTAQAVLKLHSSLYLSYYRKVAIKFSFKAPFPLVKRWKQPRRKSINTGQVDNLWLYKRVLRSNSNNYMNLCVLLWPRYTRKWAKANVSVQSHKHLHTHTCAHTELKHTTHIEWYGSL